MENEAWKPVVGYEGYYEVSNFGKVRSVRWRGGRQTHEIFHDLKESGYVEVLLIRDKKRKYKRVHQLVAEAFIPNPENKPQIDHIDGNRCNNHVENLRWCTQIENVNNPITLQRKAASQVEPAKKKWREGCFDMVKKPVLQYSLDGELIAEWASSSDAARHIASGDQKIRTTACKIAQCSNKRMRQSMGFIWVRKGGEQIVKELVEKNKKPTSIRVKVNFQDGTSKVFDSVNKAAKELGMDNITIRNRNSSQRLNITWELLNTHTCYENRWGGHREIRNMESVRKEVVK